MRQLHTRRELQKPEFHLWGRVRLWKAFEESATNLRATHVQRGVEVGGCGAGARGGVARALVQRAAKSRNGAVGLGEVRWEGACYRETAHNARNAGQRGVTRRQWTVHRAGTRRRNRVLRHLQRRHHHRLGAVVPAGRCGLVRLVRLDPQTSATLSKKMQFVVDYCLYLFVVELSLN